MKFTKDLLRPPPLRRLKLERSESSLGSIFRHKRVSSRYVNVGRQGTPRTRDPQESRTRAARTGVRAVR